MASNQLKTTRGDNAEMPRVGRLVHGAVLVTGGVLAGITYEVIGVPLDNMRRLLRSSGIPNPSSSFISKVRSAFHYGLEHANLNGIQSIFRRSDVIVGHHHKPSRSDAFLRTLGRVGPYGFAFLVWEAFGPEGLSV
jgi:hypothetical protein